MVTEKHQLFRQTAMELGAAGFGIERRDEDRSWGGFFVIDESQAPPFADAYFSGLPVAQLRIAGQLSPKILLAAPHKCLHT